MEMDFTRTGIKVGLELYLNAEEDSIVTEHFELMYSSGLMNDVDHVLSVMEVEEAYILFPFIVKLMNTQIIKLKENLRNVKIPGMI
ncbi:hypothetical protein QFZ31_006387 [Neobacillus niacini]|uniref:hypothetical protein n=1 Tax=Neobacillus driksii TaxID=3035913 RepID=UPI002788820E|nr:hypothetical protein [Neobacillus niacini]MDQ0976509.1 hypothetical protein [Neobacillus niacini]